MNTKVFEKKIGEQMKEFALSQEAQENIKATKSDKDYIVRFKITGEEVDRDGEIIKQSGIDWSHFDKNPVILIDHNYRVNSIAGKALKRETQGTDTYLVVQLAKGVAAGELIKRLHMQGMIKGVSIGFIAKERDKDDSKIITKSEALEASFVTMGSYRDALVDDEALSKSCKEAGLLDVSEKKIEASKVSVGDNISYRSVFKDTDSLGVEVERVYPRENELPMMGKVIAKYTSGNLLDWGELIIPSEENPFVIIQAYVKSKKGSILLRTYANGHEFDKIRVDAVIEQKSIEDQKVEFSSQEIKNQNFDSNEILDNIKEIGEKVDTFTSELKVFADDNAKVEKIERARKAGQGLATLLGDALKELK